MGLLPTPERYRQIVRCEANDPAAYAWRALFWWLRWPYGLGVWVRNKMYDWGLKKSVRVPGVVISVGNLSLGGTGKTPCVEYLARQFRELGQSVAIISRGYGVQQGPNDEALMLEENLPDVPHLQNPNRVESALAAITELECDVIVLDDGFQHRRLTRDVNIVLLDSSESVFHDYLAPRGMLREPVSSIARADIIIITRCTIPQHYEALQQILQRRWPGKPVMLARHQPTELLDFQGNSEDLQACRGVKVGMLCGIGNPTAFRGTLQDLEASIVSEKIYADHHNYTREDVEHLIQWASTLPEDAMILTTQKDLVKLQLPDLAGRKLLAVRVVFQFLQGEDVLLEKLQSLLPQTDET